MLSNPDLLVSRIVFVGLIVEAIEILLLRRAFAAGELFSSSHMALLTAANGRLAGFAATLGGTRLIALAMIAQAAAAGVLVLAGTGHPAGLAAAVVCLGSNCYLQARRPLGGSGADQLTFIVLVTVVLVLLAGATRQARQLGDLFIAAEVVLAYLASGISKAVSPTWRGGAMGGVLSPEGYGMPALARLLLAHPAWDRLISWLVIAWEISFPLVLIAPTPVMVVLFAIGVIFHLSCAIVMGLNRFVWAFCGCYPAVWATAAWLRHHFGG